MKKLIYTLLLIPNLCFAEHLVPRDATTLTIGKIPNERMDYASHTMLGSSPLNSFQSSSITATNFTANVATIPTLSAIRIQLPGGSVLSLPNTDGSLNDVLQTNGSGILTFTTLPTTQSNSTFTTRIILPGDIYASSSPFNRIPFPGAAIANGGSTWTVTGIQLYTGYQSTTCSTMGYVGLSSGTPNATGSRITPFVEVTTAAAVTNTVNYSAFVSTGFTVNAGSLLTFNLSQANGCGLCLGGCNGVNSSDAMIAIRYSNPGGTP